MTKITVKPDCGNAPKKALIRDFNIAFAKGAVNLILDTVSEDITWCVYGDFEVSGKDAFRKEILKMQKYPAAKELILDAIITHGPDAAANGLMVMHDGTYAFCDVYRFKSAGSKVIKSIKSFVVKV